MLKSSKSDSLNRILLISGISGARKQTKRKNLGGEAMKDRFTKGLVAGALAGVVHAAFSLTSRFILNWTDKSVAGFGSLISFNKSPEGLFEHLWGLLVYLGVSAFLGVVFAYLILLISHEMIYLKAIVFSAASWFLLLDVITPRISGMTNAPFTLGTVSSESVGSALYGIVLAYAYSYFVNKVRLE